MAASKKAAEIGTQGFHILAKSIKKPSQNSKSILPCFPFHGIIPLEDCKMGISKQIKMAMLDKGIKPAVLADMTGQGTQTLYNSLSRDNMRVDKAARLADALQCDIVLRDRETGKIYD